MKTVRQFLDQLVTQGLISEEESRRLPEEYKEDAFPILAHLLKKGDLQRAELGRLWGDFIGFPYVDLGKTLFQHQIVEMLPERFARKYKIILLYQFGDAITAAMTDPGNGLMVEEVERITKRQISPVFAFPEDIEEAIDIQYQSTDSIMELSSKIDLEKLMEGAKGVSLEELQRIAGDEAVIEFTRGLLMLGIKERASDIHIEPGEENIRVRYRVDGVLQKRLTLDKNLLAPLVSRIKVIAGVNIVEKRRPQDGRITFSLPKRSLDLRFSTVPTIYGEKIVLRILGQAQMRAVPALRGLEFSTTVLSKLERVIDTPNGVFFVTGPTGSGKTTTLYGVLNHLNTPGINIMTIEDPVEYRLPGINQVQVNHAINLDFASALRSFLRQDPDVILVGEIRDAESARIAAQAALTGHLVMSTMHTNNALQAVTRLIEVGVEPFLVAPSIIGVMAQRLVRRICDHCKEAYPLTPQQIEEMFSNWDGKREVLFYKGKGCPQCNYTGYFGRLAIHEIFIINDEVRELIAKGSSILAIQECAHKYGFMNMRYDGVKKVLRGLTTIDEIDRVTVWE